MTATHWAAGRFRLDLHRPLVMGIVNLTPDSFSDGGQFADPAAGLRHAQTLVEQGADILDVGGESTRPGSAPPTDAQEWARIEPVLREIMRWNVPVSVDTYRPATMRRALDLGVDIINDVAALRQPGAEELVADSTAGVCLMHMQGLPTTMQVAPHYDDVRREVRDFLLDRAQALLGRGVAAERICLDPGFGFGKTLEHNVSLMHGLGELVACGYPVLVGFSRKSMIGGLTGKPVEQRMAGSVAAALAGVSAGAQIVRVHDVAETRDALTVWRALHEEKETE